MGQEKRYDAIRAATEAKLQSRRSELDALPRLERAQRLIDEAVSEFYDDQVAAYHDYEFIERIVWNLISAADKPPPVHD